MAGQIDAAAERELIVDDDDLLMMRAADGMTIVEAESHVRVHPPAQPPSRQRVALERVERGVVPDQDVAAKLRPLSRDEREQLVESRRAPPFGFDGTSSVPAGSRSTVAP